ncbi:MAG: hypothetical protein NTV51_20510 [Verrucomicrobia bacterium]|nr:hypothetical protein [Verrucomicrobiota bacterium]
MRTAIYSGLALLALATLALWSEAHQVDGRIEDLTLTLSQRPDGQVVGVLHNLSKGRVMAWVSPFCVEALKDGTWATVKPEILSCGSVDGREYHAAPGQQVEFRVDGWMEMLKEGDPIRACVGARSGFNAGSVTSNAVQFSKAKWGRQFSVPLAGSRELPVMALPAPPENH